MDKCLKIGTRTSPLALWQSHFVGKSLVALFPDLQYELVSFNTQGDRLIDKPLPEVGGKGLFTAELDAAIRSGEVDIAVHSLKDLPTAPQDGLCLAAIPKREDVRDVLVAKQGLTIPELAPHSTIGTSSLRRQAQLLRIRPDLKTASIRGNVQTRIQKVFDGEFDATLLAAAGLHRLGLQHHISQYLSLEAMLPAPGQGALGIQCSVENVSLIQILKHLHHIPTDLCVRAERAFLNALDSGCSTPVGAYARFGGKHETIHLEIVVSSPDGTSSLRMNDKGKHPEDLGKRLAERALLFQAKNLLEK